MRHFKWLLLALYSTACLLVYPSLPERVPFHLGAAGVVDDTAGRNLLVWLALPGASAVLLVAAHLAVNWAVKHPEFWLIPEKRRFLCLSDARRAPLYAELRKLVDVMSISFLLLFAAIQYLMFEAAVQGSARFPAPFRLMLVLFSAYVILYIVRFSLRLRAMILEDDPPNPIRVMG
jgi:uncharacterized membrane protein